MKSYIPVFIAVFTLVTYSANAQLKRPGFLLGGNIHYAKPSGDFSNTHNYGLGAEGFGGVGFGKTFVVATVGIASFQAHNKDVGNVTYTPVKLGVRQYLFGRNLFVNGDLGVASVKQAGVKESRFTRGIGVGARLLGFEAALYYDGWKSVNTSGFSNSVNVKVGTSISL